MLRHHQQWAAEAIWWHEENSHEDLVEWIVAEIHAISTEEQVAYKGTLSKYKIEAIWAQDVQEHIQDYPPSLSPGPKCTPA